MNPRLVLAGLPSMIEGIDTDPAAVWVANVVLAAEVLPLLSTVPEAHRRPLPALARTGDGLAIRAPARAVVMNPPYGRVKLDEAERDRFKDVLFGHANIYSLFMASAVDQLEDEGVVGALVPTSFMSGRYFTPLRERLSTSVRLKSVLFVEERSGVFTSVLQETCLAVFTRNRVRRTHVASHGEFRTEIGTIDTPLGGRPWLIPRRSDMSALASGASAMPRTLGELGWKASTGPLVWNRRRDDLSRDGGTKVIWASDLVDGSVQASKVRDDMRTVQLRGDRDRRTMILSDPAILVQRTTAPEQMRRLVPAALDADTLAAWGGEVVVENHVNVLRPVGDPKVSHALLARLLATSTLDAVARCISGSVALSAFELESLPMPEAEAMQGWEELDDRAFAQAVADAYRKVAS